MCNCNPTGFLASQYELILPPSSYVHDTTTHGFSIVASAPGTPHSSLSSNFKAVCCSEKSWWARRQHPDCAADRYHDGLRRLAPSSQPCATAAPYGIESFGEVLKSLWLGIRLHRGKGESCLRQYFFVMGTYCCRLTSELRLFNNIALRH